MIMNNSEKLILVNGTYKQEDAKEILMNVFNQKVLFHEKKQFSSLVRFGKEDESTAKRILELKHSMILINEIIDKANAENKLVSIHSDVFISLVDE